MMKRLLFCGIAALVAAVPSRADWDPGDGHKMHSPQLPDPNGWDVDVQQYYVADDWTCSSTGTVSDVHFWLSWQGDHAGPPSIDSITLRIHADIPAGTGGINFSRPGNLLWTGIFQQTDFTYRLGGNGPQGYVFNPSLLPGGGYFAPPDHTKYWQINIEDIADPFVQQVGTIYWLDLSVSGTSYVGWKTSDNHHGDAAVSRPAAGGSPWAPMYDPYQPAQGLDMAFVITPEPSAAMLGLFGTVLLALRRRLIS
jgi:hypothetical protein